MRKTWFAAMVAILTTAVSGVGAQPMPPTAGLELWLDASEVESISTGDERELLEGAPVAEWKDLQEAGEADNAVQARPEYRPVWKPAVPELNSRSAIYFDGENDYLHLPSLQIGPQMTTIFVAENRQQTTGGSHWRVLLGGDNEPFNSGGVNYIFSFQRAGIPSKFTAAVFTEPKPQSVAIKAAQEPGDGMFHLYAVRRRGLMDNGTEIIVDGRMAGRGTIGREGAGFPRQGYALANGGDVSKPPMRNYRGHVAEVVVYNRALTDPELRQALTYLNAKYQLEANRPKPAPELPPVSGRQLPVDAGLTLWLDASYPGSARAVGGDRPGDGEAVAAWVDRPTPGSNRSIEQVLQNVPARRPTLDDSVEALGGKSAIRFDGEDDFLHVPGLTLTEEMTTFIVAENAVQTEGGSVWRCILAGDDDGFQGQGKYGFTLYRKGSGVGFNLAMFGADKESQLLKPNPPAAQQDGEWHVYMGLAQPSGQARRRLEVRRDGAAKNAAVFDAPPMTDPTGYTIGQGMDVVAGEPGRCYRGGVAEIIVYDRPLKEIEIRMVHAYLKAKYGLSAIVTE